MAHRAGNDPAAIGAARAAGADAVEADVHVRGRHVEVRHLKSLGPVPWLWDRWYLAPRPASPVVLEDVLDAAASGTGLLLDLKGPSPRLASLVRAAVRGHARGPVWVCSRTWSHLRGAWGEDDVRLLRSIGSRLQLARFHAQRGAGDGVSVHARLLDERTVAGLRQRVPLVLAWGATDAATASRLWEWGVDGLILDDLDLIARLRGRSDRGR